MPSPIEAASRRIACESVTICSVAMVSGSISRIATSAMELATCFISWARRAITPVTKMKTIGASSASSVSTGLGARKEAFSWSRISPWLK